MASRMAKLLLFLCLLTFALLGLSNPAAACEPPAAAPGPPPASAPVPPPASAPVPPPASAPVPPPAKAPGQPPATAPVAPPAAPCTCESPAAAPVPPPTPAAAPVPPPAAAPGQPPAAAPGPPPAAAPGAAPRKMVGIYELKKGNFSVKVTNFGATIMSVILPDCKGKLDDVVLGFDKVGPYVVNPPRVNETYYFGAIVGRVANRVANAEFTLNATIYHLYPNDGNNSLHGGHRGFGQDIWDVKEKVDCEFPYITFHYKSFDGEQGYPGNLDVYVTYKISNDYELTVNMEAKALDKSTPVNLAQHSYWNLGGEGSGTILSDSVQILASQITPVDDHLIPFGNFSDVAGTPYDFTQPLTVGSRIEHVKGGYDINYVLDSPFNCEGLRKAAYVKNCDSGRSMELWTNQPGLQFYSGNFLKGVAGKHGHVYEQHDGLCLETQGFPDAVNHDNFPSQIVNTGEFYIHKMVYKFSF